MANNKSERNKMCFLCWWWLGCCNAICLTLRLLPKTATNAFLGLVACVDVGLWLLVVG